MYARRVFIGQFKMRTEQEETCLHILNTLKQCSRWCHIDAC